MNILDAINQSIVKWEDPAAEIKIQCGFCKMAKEDMEKIEGIKVLGMCWYCKIDKYICQLKQLNRELLDDPLAPHTSFYIKAYPILQQKILYYLYNKRNREMRQLKKGDGA